MPLIFNKNAIISGEIDFYCLVCEDKLKTEDDVNTHIQKAIHRKNFIQKSSYVVNHEDEKIRKVTKGYYCEYCNILLKSSLKIPIHIKHKNHEYNKSDDVDVTSVDKHAKRHENYIIVLDQLLVNEKAWNGLIDYNCAYCNIEFDNEELHKMDSTHIINLIQAQLLIGENRSVYRKIDSHMFHCLTCNELLPFPTESHFENDAHNECYIHCRKDKKALFNDIGNTIPLIKTQENRTSLENISQKDLKVRQQVDVEELNTKITSKDEKANDANIADPIPDNDPERITLVGKTEDKPETENMVTASTNNEAKSKEKTKTDVVKFASENHIYYDFSPNQAYCRICKAQIPKGLASMNEHVKGARHTRNIPEKNVIMSAPAVQKKPYKTQSLKDFIESLGKAENFITEVIILNEKFCMSPSSFHIITSTAAKCFRCHMCEKSFNSADVSHHLQFDSHHSRLMETPVIISEETEFIRIPRDGIFHCGFCNLILAGWSDVQNHMKSLNHRKCKIQYSRALENILSEIKAHKLRDEIIMRAIIRKMFNNFF